LKLVCLTPSAQKICMQLFPLLTAGLPVEMCVYEGSSWLYVDHIKRLHGIFQMDVRADCPEGAEVLSPNQQGGSLAHGSHIQLPDQRQKQETFLFNK